MAITFDSNLSVDNLLVIGTAVVGLVGGWFTLKGKTDEGEKRFGELEGDRDVLRDKMSSLELHVANECVKRMDLEKVETRLGKRMDDIEHTVRNTATKMVGEVREMLRDLLPRTER